MTRVIIIEDEKYNINILQGMLQNHFKNIDIVAVCENTNDAMVAIEALQPDLVFTDIELHGTPVFEMLEQLNNINFDIIFITAHERYAIQAIRFAAIDYLLKPFSLSGLSEAIKRYEQKKDKQQSASRFNTLFHNLKHLQKDAKKIALPTANGLAVVPVKEIIRCQADVNYTHFFLEDKRKMLVSKTLKEFEEMLNDYDFIRVHQSHLINLHHIKNYARGEGGIVTMTDGTEVDVSRRKKEEFLKRLAEL